MEVRSFKELLEAGGLSTSKYPDSNNFVPSWLFLSQILPTIEGFNWLKELQLAFYQKNLKILFPFKRKVLANFFSRECESKILDERQTQKETVEFFSLNGNSILQKKEFYFSIFYHSGIHSD